MAGQMQAEALRLVKQAERTAEAHGGFIATYALVPALIYSNLAIAEAIEGLRRDA